MDSFEKIKFGNSFATRISLLTLVATTCVFVVCFGMALWFASAEILSDGHEKANLELDKAMMFVTGEMETVETAGNNFVQALDVDGHATPESMFAACRNFLNVNPAVHGVAIGFEPGVYPEYRKGFSPYVMRGHDGKFKETMLSDKSDFYSKEWYSQTKKERKRRWSDPFFEVNGNVICSYCIPLVNKQGKFVGVLAVDMSLEDLTEHLQSVKPYPKSYLTILDRNFNFVVHPDKRLILKGNPMQVLKGKQYEVNETIFVDMKNRVRGIGAFGEHGDTKYLYYAPVKHVDWTITLECDKGEITAGVSAIRWQMFVVSLLGMLGLLFVTFVVVRRFMRPIRLYSNAAMKIAGGNFHTHLPRMRTHNELWALGNSLNHMQHSLEKYIGELAATTQEKGRIESELRIASQIQMAMIPKIFPPYPDRDDVDIYGTLIPAKAVGGDLYDFFLRDDKLFFCVGDVSGKGVPASLVMAVTRSLLRIVAAQESRPDRIVASLNNSMSDMNESNMFVTLFVGVLDLPTGRFRYCNAGHNAPVIIDDRKKTVEMLDVKPNLPIAIMQSMKFEMQETHITPDTAIFMYTDGLTEAENNNKELFGDRRMMDELKKMMGKTSKECIEDMLGTVQHYVDGADQSDDLTMITIKYKRQQADKRFYRRLSLHNDIRETPKIADFMDDIVGETGIDTALASSINLALEEAVVNVMNYAYPSDTVGDILIEAYANKERLKFVITDNGIPFDPTTTVEPDITACVEDRAIGGLGIFLVQHIMDTVDYERVGNENVLTLRKMLNVKK